MRLSTLKDIMASRSLFLVGALSLTACATPAFTPTSERPTPITLAAAGEVDALATGLATRGEDGVVTLRLVQRPCRFQEAEPNATFQATSAKACADLNASTIPGRQGHTIVVPAGKLRLVVSSQDVPYELGFWIRAFATPTRALAQGGGILPGVAKTYDVELSPGRYVYACPLNPTPDYVIEVR